MHKKLYVVGMLSLLLVGGCGQGEKQAETPVTTPAPVEQAAPVAQKPAGEAMKPPEQPAAPAPEKKTAPAAKEEKAPPAPETTAADQVANAPETVTLDNKQGVIVLPHKKHAEAFGCAACHGDQKPGPFALNKEKGHALCLGCHKKKQAGPTSCPKCHQKKG